MPETLRAKQVREFHATFGQYIAESESLPTPDLTTMRQAILAEEVEELIAAIDAGDGIETVDALADITYVAYGTALTYGFDLDAAVARTPAPTMAEVTSPLALRDDLDALALATSNADCTAFADRLAEVVLKVERMAAVIGVDLSAVVTEVHRSNMSKLGADGKPIYRADGKVLKGPGYSPPNIAAVIGLPLPGSVFAAATAV